MSPTYFQQIIRLRQVLSDKDGELVKSHVEIKQLKAEFAAYKAASAEVTCSKHKVTVEGKAIQCPLCEIERLTKRVIELEYVLDNKEDGKARDDEKFDYTWPEAFHDVAVVLSKSRKLGTHIPRSLDGEERRLNAALTNAHDIIDRVLSSDDYKHENHLDRPSVYAITPDGERHPVPGAVVLEPAPKPEASRGKTKVYLTPLGKISAMGEVSLRETGKTAAEVMDDNEQHVKESKPAQAKHPDTREVQEIPAGIPSGKCFICKKECNTILPDVADYCCSDACADVFWKDFAKAQKPTATVPKPDICTCQLIDLKRDTDPGCPIHGEKDDPAYAEPVTAQPGNPCTDCDDKGNCGPLRKHCGPYRKYRGWKPEKDDPAHADSKTKKGESPDG